MLQQVARLDDTVDPAAPRPAEALPAALAALTNRRPVMLVIEDLHWADISTRDLVAFLAAGPAIPGLLVVATYRADDLSRRHPLLSVLVAIDRADRVRHVRLSPFGAADLTEQLSGILGHQPDAALVRTVIERSDGNPFLVEELADADPHDDVPPGARDLLLSRLDRLDDDAQHILRTVAIGGRRLRHDLLAAVSDVEDHELAAGLRQAISHHLLLVADDHDYEFRHALLHEAVLRDVLPGESTATHTAYANAIEAKPDLGAPDPSAALFHHWSAAGRTGSALPAAISAAADAESAYALPEAQRYYEWALGAWDGAVPQKVAPERLAITQDELLRRAADVASRAGDLDRAAELVGDALSRIDVAAQPAQAGLLHERRGWTLLQAGHVDDALAAYEHAVELVPAQPPSAARARVLAAYADANERADRIDTAIVVADEAIAVARAAGSSADEGHARHTRGAALAASGDRDAGIAELDRALAIAEASGDVADVAGIHLHLWRELAQLGRGGDVVDRALDGAARARRQRIDVLAAVLDGIAAGYCHQLGRWAEADDLILAAGPERLGGVVHLIVGGLLDLDRGDVARAGDRLEAARGYTDRLRDGRIDGLIYRGLAERAWWLGRLDEVHDLVDTGLGRTSDPEMQARIVLIELRGDPTAPVRKLLDELDSRAVARHLEPASELRAIAATGLAETRRATAPDPADWVEAILRWDAIGFPIPAIYGRWRQGEAYLTAGDRDTAADVLATAWKAADQLGATPWRSVIETSARRARLRIGQHADAVAPLTATDRFGLTSREDEVLALLGRGRTNRQIAEQLFISEKTARVHVSHILAKLAASTRGEAVDIAHRRGLIG